MAVVDLSTQRYLHSCAFVFPSRTNPSRRKRVSNSSFHLEMTGMQALDWSLGRTELLQVLPYHRSKVHVLEAVI